MLRLFQEILQLNQLDLQMKLPVSTVSVVLISLEITHIAMNSSMELSSAVLRRFGINDVSSVTLVSVSSWRSGSGENELEATKRVYSQPMFKQKLAEIPIMGKARYMRSRKVNQLTRQAPC